MSKSSSLILLGFGEDYASDGDMVFGGDHAGDGDMAWGGGGDTYYESYSEGLKEFMDSRMATAAGGSADVFATPENWDTDEADPQPAADGGLTSFIVPAAGDEEEGSPAAGEGETPAAGGGREGAPAAADPPAPGEGLARFIVGTRAGE